MTPATPNPARRPRTGAGRFSYATDNKIAADRYAVHFDDGRVLVVWTGGSHSAWSTSEEPLPHLPGERVGWAQLPLAVRREVWARCEPKSDEGRDRD